MKKNGKRKLKKWRKKIGVQQSDEEKYKEGSSERAAVER